MSYVSYHLKPRIKPLRFEGKARVFKSGVLDGNKHEVKAVLSGYPEYTSGPDINMMFEQSSYAVNALMHASGNGDEDIVEILLEKGADVNIQNKQGYTALILASMDGHTPIVKQLLAKGANKDLTTKDGKTAYDLASNSEIKDLLKAKEKLSNTTVTSVNKQPTYKYEPNEQLNNQNAMGGRRHKKTRKSKNKKSKKGKSRKH